VLVADFRRLGCPMTSINPASTVLTLTRGGKPS